AASTASITCLSCASSFFFQHPATPETYTLSLHDALPILAPGAGTWRPRRSPRPAGAPAARRTASEAPRLAHATAGPAPARRWDRSEEHTSELLSLAYLVCRLLLEKKKKKS